MPSTFLRNSIYGTVALVVSCLAFLGMVVTANWFFYTQDSSDPPGGRSGLRVMTDFATGCQYVMVPGSGLVARLNEKGKPICQSGNKKPIMGMDKNALPESVESNVESNAN